MNYCIIGNSAAAIGAIEGIRKIDRTGTITVISAEPYHTYSRPLISYYLAGKVEEDKMYYRPMDFYESCKVDVIYNTSAERIDTQKREVILPGEVRVPCDKLLIATGGKPFVPPVEGLDRRNVFTFQKWDDVKEIQKAVKPGTKAVIIGAGLIGMKAAEALSNLGTDVTVVEMANRVLSSILDEKAATLVRNVMEEHGIRFCLENTVKQVLGGEEVTGVELSGGQQLPCDILIAAVGVVPDTEVVRGTTIQVNRGILVNDKMETSVPGIYAAGDVAEGEDALLGIQRVIPILPNAYRQGEIAGKNMAGEDVSFEGGFPMNAIGFYGYSLITAGILGGAGYEELSASEPEEKFYRKIVLKDNRLVGFIALKKIDRLGMLTGLIAEKRDAQDYKEKLLKPDFGYIDLPGNLRRERMLAAGGAAR